MDYDAVNFDSAVAVGYEMYGSLSADKESETSNVTFHQAIFSQSLDSLFEPSHEFSAMAIHSDDTGRSDHFHLVKTNNHPRASQKYFTE